MPRRCSHSARPSSFIYANAHTPAPATYPPAADGQSLNAGIHGLATRQWYAGTCRHAPRWALTPPFHPYPLRGGCFLLRFLLSPHEDLPVRKCGALRCPDFPHSCERGRAALLRAAKIVKDSKKSAPGNPEAEKCERKCLETTDRYRLARITRVRRNDR